MEGSLPVSEGSRKPLKTIDIAYGVFVPSDSLRLLSELFSLTVASLLVIRMAMIRERGD
jgi:hypothetical protein